MARAYNIATAALALKVSIKWLDNVLSHHSIAGVEQEGQGIARRLSLEGLLKLSISVLLIQEFDLPTARALEITHILINNQGHYESSAGLMLSLNLRLLENNLLGRLEYAVESAPSPRRGRPPTSKTGRLD